MAYFIWSMPQQNYLAKGFSFRSRSTSELAKGADWMNILVNERGLKVHGVKCMQCLGCGRWSINTNCIFSILVLLIYKVLAVPLKADAYEINIKNLELKNKLESVVNHLSAIRGVWHSVYAVSSLVVYWYCLPKILVSLFYCMTVFGMHFIYWSLQF